MLITDLLVHERLCAVGERAWEGAFGVGGRGGEMFLRNVARECRFGSECRRAGCPAARCGAFESVHGLEVLFEVGGRGKGGAACGAAGHEPLTDSLG